jgi:predicted HTH domain antitoxin
MEIKFMYENIIIREEEKVVKERKVDLYHYDYEQKPLLIDMATNGLVLSYNII